MSTLSRRGLLRGLLATTALGAVPWREPERLLYPVPDAPFEYSGFYSLYGELSDVTRKAFVPRLFVNLSCTNPLVEALTDASPRL